MMKRERYPAFQNMSSMIHSLTKFLFVIQIPVYSQVIRVWFLVMDEMPTAALRR
jgi:hypothetical protein